MNRRHDDFTAAEIERSQSLIAAVLGPEEMAKLDAEAAEMERALDEYVARHRARQTTATDLGVCSDCAGEGSYESSHPVWDDPYFCVVKTCPTCGGSGWVGEASPARTEEDLDQEDDDGLPRPLRTTATDLAATLKRIADEVKADRIEAALSHYEEAETDFGVEARNPDFNEMWADEDDFHWNRERSEEDD